MAKELSREERLAKLRSKLQDTDLGGSSQRYWSPDEGRNVIRILPAVGEMDYFFQTVGRHYLPGGENVYCPQFTSEGELDCPICDLVNDLYNSGDKASKELAGKLRVSKRYWMNVIDRENESAGPLIFTPGVTIMNTFASYINDPDYGVIFDIYDGMDMIIERSGKGLNTEYEVKARPRTEPLSEDEDQIDEWLDAATEIMWTQLSMDPDEDAELSEGYAVWVKPYDRIIAEHSLDFMSDEYEEEEEEPAEEEEEEKEESKAKKETRRRSSRRRRR